MNFSWKTIEPFNDYDEKQIGFLLETIELLIFHSLIMLLSSNDLGLDDKAIFEKELKNLIKTEFLHDADELQRRINRDLSIKLKLPISLALDMLLKYGKYDEACELLFYSNSKN